MSEKTLHEEKLSRDEVADRLQAIAHELRGDGDADIDVGNKTVTLSPSSGIGYEIGIRESSSVLRKRIENEKTQLETEPATRPILNRADSNASIHTRLHLSSRTPMTTQMHARPRQKESEKRCPLSPGRIASPSLISLPPLLQLSIPLPSAVTTSNLKAPVIRNPDSLSPAISQIPPTKPETGRGRAPPSFVGILSLTWGSINPFRGILPLSQRLARYRQTNTSRTPP